MKLRRPGSRGIYWPGFLALLALAAGIAFVVNYLTGIEFWACFGLVVLGIAVNGFISFFDD